MKPRFVDTNVLLRHLTHDDDSRAPKATSLLLRAESGEERLALSPMIVFECIFTLQSRYKTPRARIRQALVAILAPRAIELADKDLFLRALDLYVEQSISFGDAYNVAYMESRGLDIVYSWDAHYDRVPGITRREP